MKLCWVIGVVAVALHAQSGDAPAIPTIRTETRVTLVDAVAVDKHGKFARDLTATDFHVREDGREQKVTGFSLESAGLSADHPHSHYIAFFFDASSLDISNQAGLRNSATGFTDHFAGADRYMAVLAYDTKLSILQNFTVDPAAMKKGVGAVPFRSSAPTAAYQPVLSALRETAAALASIRGRKALVLFSGGPVNAGEDLSGELRKTIDALNKANVAVYTVDSRFAAATTIATASATAANVGALRSENRQGAQNVLRPLAEGTGGVIFPSQNDLANVLGRVAEEQDEYYLLSYTPSVESAEGTCHELRVTVDRPGLEVRARKSYCTVKPKDGLAGKPVGADLEAKAAGTAAGDIQAKIQLPYFYTGPNEARVMLAADVVPSAMTFSKDKLHGEFDLVGVAYAADQSVAARFSDTVKLNFETPRQADDFLNAPYHYANQFEIAPGQYRFQFAIESGGKGFGKAEMALRVEPWSGQELGMSGLALSHDARRLNADQASGLAAGLDSSMLEDEHPLVSRGVELKPAGTAQFRPGERGFFYFEVYGRKDLTIRIRVEERASGKQVFDSPMSGAPFVLAGSSVVAVGLALPSADLAVGAYRLSVEVRSDQDVQPVARTVDFDIQ